MLITHPFTPMCPSPWSPWSDPELERLRRLQAARCVEEEKERLRQWLRRHGVCDQQIFPGIIRPLPWMPTANPIVPCPLQGRISTKDVLKKLG